MSYIQGNAFAQMKAKERARQQQMGEGGSQEQEPRPGSGSGRRSNGLDYDQELALPMPKPRHLPPTEAELAEVESRQRRSSSTNRTRLSKKRSGAMAAADSPTSSEKKKSMIASLRSKLSLKDLARELRRDRSSSPPAMPALRKSSSSGFTVERGPRTPRLAQSSPNFDEERLYVPKARQADSEQPASAPPATSSFQESLSSDRASQSSIYSSPPGYTATMTKGDKKTAKFRHTLVHNENDDGTRTDKRLKTFLLDGSSPPAHTGQMQNTGHPEVVTSGQRICSMKAEEGPATPVKAAEAIVPAVGEYSPSIYDDDSLATSAPISSPVEQKKPATDKPQPLVVTSDQKGKRTAPRAVPNRPAFVPLGPGSHQQQPPFAHQFDPQMPRDEARFFTGTTSHGGFAPPPPHPGYQNTTTLEQHVTSHANSIHHHIDVALGKLGRNAENNINWSTDQVIRQVESVTDLARMLNTRTVNQADLIREVQQAVEYLRIQVSEMQHQAYRMQDKLVECIHVELSQLRAEMRNLAANRAPYNTAGGWNSSHGELQGASQNTARGSKEFFDKRAYARKKARAATVPKSEAKKPAEGKKVAAEQHGQEGECVVASAATLAEPGKSAEKQEQTCAAGDPGDLSERCDNSLHSPLPVPTLISTFRTSSVHDNEVSTTTTDCEIERTPKNPRQSCGSPEPKRSNQDTPTHSPLLSPGDSDTHKMVFGFGRSDKDKKSRKADNKGTHSPQKDDKSEQKDVKPVSDEVASHPKDENPKTETQSKHEGKPKAEGEPSAGKATIDNPITEKSPSKDANTDKKDVKSTPKDKKQKRGMFGFKRRDGGNQSPGGFIRTPQRHKENKPTLSLVPAHEPSKPIPIPKHPNFGSDHWIPHHPREHFFSGEPSLPSTEVDPAFVHPALRTPEQISIMAEREKERLRHESLARQQAEDPCQSLSQGFPEQTLNPPQEVMHYGPAPLLPHHIPGTSIGGGLAGASPVNFRPTLPGRQQRSVVLNHPLDFGQATQAISTQYPGGNPYTNNLATSPISGAPNVMMPPHYQHGIPFPDVNFQRWYQETHGHACSEGERPFQALPPNPASQGHQGNQPGQFNQPNPSN